MIVFISKSTYKKSFSYDDVISKWLLISSQDLQDRVTEQRRKQQRLDFINPHNHNMQFTK